MDTIAWTEDYSVNIPAIDNEHRLLLGLLNDVERLVSQDKAIQVPLAVAALERLARAVQRHFESEERFLLFNNYPEFDVHHAEHVQLMERMERFRQRFGVEGKPFNERMLLFLRDWFARHIILYDSRIGTYYRGKEIIDKFG
jgi:hemerythrin